MRPPGPDDALGSRSRQGDDPVAERSMPVRATRPTPAARRRRSRTSGEQSSCRPRRVSPGRCWRQQRRTTMAVDDRGQAEMPKADADVLQRLGLDDDALDGAPDDEGRGDEIIRALGCDRENSALVCPVVDCVSSAVERRCAVRRGLRWQRPGFTVEARRHRTAGRPTRSSTHAPVLEDDGGQRRGDRQPREPRWSFRASAKGAGPGVWVRGHPAKGGARRQLRGLACLAAAVSCHAHVLLWTQPRGPDREGLSSIAQLAEQPAVNRRVLGSSPSGSQPRARIQIRAAGRCPGRLKVWYAVSCARTQWSPGVAGLWRSRIAPRSSPRRRPPPARVPAAAGPPGSAPPYPDDGRHRVGDLAGVVPRRLSRRSTPRGELSRRIPLVVEGRMKRATRRRVGQPARCCA